MPRICLVIPVYNHERALALLLEALRPHGLPCILVDDASSPDSAAVLDDLAARESSWVHLVRHAVNQGKGGAVCTGLREALRRGHTHALQIDADGQHAAEDIPRFVAACQAHPDSLVCGAPVFDDSVPRARLWGRQITNLWIWINTLSLDIKDGLCGFRLYPLAPVVALIDQVKLGQRMDFDPEVLVRLKWRGLAIQTLPVKVHYPLDGTSHFKLGLDNWLISRMHARMFLGMLVRWPLLLWRKVRPPRAGAAPVSWSTMREAGSAGGLAFMFWVYSHLGRLPFRVALYPTLTWFYLRRPTARAASREFLTRALGRPASWRQGIKHFLSFADAMLDKLVAWNDGFGLEDLEFRGREKLAELLEAKRGCILVGSHLGNVEVCRVLSKWRTNMELHVLTHTEHAENFNRILKKINPGNEVNLHQVKDLDVGLAAWLSERVQNGAVLVTTGDRIPVEPGSHTVGAPFLGAEAQFPEGPFVLAHALGCPVMLLFCIRKGKKFEVSLELFAERVRLPRGAGRAPALAEVVVRYAARLAERAREHPYQWFNFYPYWQPANPGSSAATSAAPSAAPARPAMGAPAADPRPVRIENP